MVRTILRNTVTAALLLTVVAGVALITAVLMPNPAAAGPVAPRVHVTTLGPDAAFLAELVGPDTDLTPEQAARILEAADLVCEGITARVPPGTMTATLRDAYGFTVYEATDLENLATATRC